MTTYDELSNTIFRFSPEDKEKIEKFKGTYPSKEDLENVNPDPSISEWAIVEDEKDIYIALSGAWAGLNKSPIVIDSITASSVSDALSVNQGRLLGDRVKSLEKRTNISISNDITSSSNVEAMSINLGRILNEGKVEKGISKIEENIDKYYLIKNGELVEARPIPAISDTSSGKFLTNDGSSAKWLDPPIEEDAPMDNNRYVRKDGEWVNDVSTVSGNFIFEAGYRIPLIQIKLNPVNKETGANHIVQNIIDGNDFSTFKIEKSYDYKGRTPLFSIVLSERQRLIKFKLSRLGIHSDGKWGWEASSDGLTGWRSVTEFIEMASDDTAKYEWESNITADESYFHYRIVGHPTEDTTLPTNASWNILEFKVGSFTAIPLQDAPMDSKSYLRKNSKWEPLDIEDMMPSPPLDSDVIFVCASSKAVVEDGSISSPYKTLMGAFDGVTNEKVIYILDSNFYESNIMMNTMDKSMSIFGPMATLSGSIVFDERTSFKLHLDVFEITGETTDNSKITGRYKRGNNLIYNVGSGFLTADDFKINNGILLSEELNRLSIESPVYKRVSGVDHNIYVNEDISLYTKGIRFLEMKCPVDPIDGDKFKIRDSSGTWRDDTPILNGNCKSINGKNDIVLINNNSAFEVIYDGTEWRMY